MKPLIETNPYLKNKDKCKSSNHRSAKTSCGVEGIVVTTSYKDRELDSSKTKKVLGKIKARVNRDSFVRVQKKS